MQAATPKDSVRRRFGDGVAFGHPILGNGQQPKSPTARLWVNSPISEIYAPAHLCADDHCSMQIPILKGLVFHEVVDRSDGILILDTIFGDRMTLPPNRQSAGGTAQISLPYFW